MRLEVGRVFFDVVPGHGFLQHHAWIERRVWGGAGENLKPKVGHFIAGAVSGYHAAWRVVWVGRIFAGIVIDVAHGDGRALRQRHGSRVAVHRLPVQVPLGNMNQSFFRTVRESSKRL